MTHTGKKATVEAFPFSLSRLPRPSYIDRAKKGADVAELADALDSKLHF
jgi:hypothetical protein